MSAQKRIPESS
jgi:hypothetical protein